MAKHYYTSKTNKVSHSDPTKERDSTKRYFGVYTGVVDENVNTEKTGTVAVYISALNDDPCEQVLFDAVYTSQFFGTSPYGNVKSDDITLDDNAVKSYGFWTPPPDVGSIVLIVFGDGLLSKPYIISQTTNGMPFNQMVPGIAGGPSFQGGPFNTPTTEKNQYDPDPIHNGKLRPIYHDFAEAITKQGLINDPIRGATSSSSRRESPSEVLGILTKGPRNDKGDSIGPGHQFIMDDAQNNSNIRLRTGGGTQILMDDTTGSIYVITKNGKAWFELDKNGNINFFGEGSMSIRSKGDFNLRADKNVNIEAGNNVNIKAVGDNDQSGYKGVASQIGALGVPPLGTGGKVNLHSAEDTNIHANSNFLATANSGEMQLSSAGRMTLTSTLGTALQSKGYMTVQADLKVDVLAGGAATLSAGGTTNLFGTTIGLNNPGTPPTPDLIPALSAQQLGGADKPDQSSASPEYNREEANPILNGGQRPEKGPVINTIVGKLITAEPFNGHGQFDPSTEDPSSIEEDKSVDGETLENQIDPTDDTPADADTPEGTKVGKAFQEAKDGVKSVYEDYNSALSDFNAIKNLDLSNLDGIMQMADMLNIAIPPFRIPTTNALSQKVIGQSKILKDLEAQYNQFSLDEFGLPLDLKDSVVAGMKDDISNIVNEVTGGNVEDFKSAADDKTKKILGDTGG